MAKVKNLQIIKCNEGEVHSGQLWRVKAPNDIQIGIISWNKNFNCFQFSPQITSFLLPIWIKELNDFFNSIEETPEVQSEEDQRQSWIDKL